MAGAGREFKSGFSAVKAIDDRTVTGLAAVIGNVDDYHDIIHPRSFKKTIKENSQRVRHLWQHDSYSPPIAVIKSLREVWEDEIPDSAKEKGATGGLEVVREYLHTPRADEVLEGLRAGAINEMSFAFTPIKFDFGEVEVGDMKISVRHIRELRLWDTSDVNWGANDQTVASKSAVPFADTGEAPEGESWEKPTLGDFTPDGWGDLSDSEKRRIMSHYGFSVNVPPESFGDLKLPHHRAAKSGTGPAVWNGVKAAMGALLGARGGVDMSDADRRSVYNHLKKHYDQFEKEPPDFKWYVLAESIQSLDGIAGAALLSNEKIAQLKQLGIEITEILETAESPVSDPALTAEVLRRLQIANLNVRRYE